MNDDSLIVHTDGGARGNPGPAACSFIVEQGNKIIEKKSKYLGVATNNFAEYSGVLFALDWIAENMLGNWSKKIVFYLDSELVVRQINGLYKIKNQELKSIAIKIKNLIKEKSLNTRFESIARSKNKIADYLVNKELDNKS